MAINVGLDIGEGVSVATVVDSSIGKEPKSEALKVPRMWGMFCKEDLIKQDPCHTDFWGETDRLGDFAFVLVKKVLGVDPRSVESLEICATCPYALTVEEVSHFASAMRRAGLPLRDERVIPKPLAIAYETAVTNGIDPDGMEFVLVDLDRFQCNVLVARLMMSDGVPSLTVRAMEPHRHPSHLEFNETAYSHFEQGIAYATGLDPKKLDTCWMDHVGLDIAFNGLKEWIYGGDVTTVLNLMSLEDSRDATFSRERFFLSIAPQSIQLAEDVIGTLEMACNGVSINASEHGLEPLSGPPDVDTFIICGERPYVSFASDVLGCFFRDLNNRMFIVDRPEISASRGAAILF